MKNIIPKILILVLVMSSVDVVFSSETSKVQNNIAFEETTLSDSAIKAEIVKQVNLASTTTYAVEGGNIYFDTDTGTITAADTSITSADIPSSIDNVTVTYIGDYAFQWCTSLTSITIPNSITSIGNSAFHGCTGLTSITIPNGVTSIGDSAFIFCYSLENISLSDSITSIGDKAFAWDGMLLTVNIPAGVTSIGQRVFYECYLTDIYVDDNNTAFASVNGVLYDKDITKLICCPETKSSIEIPDSVNTIGSRACLNCYKLTDITIPENVTVIEEYAFYGCKKLTAVTIPKNATVIENYAFYYCDSLTDVTILSKTVDIGTRSFGYTEDEYGNGPIVGALETVYCYEESTADNSSLYPNGVTITYLEESDYEFIFDSETGVITGYTGTPVNITIPSEIDGVSIISISSNAFKNCDSLISVTISNGVESIEKSAFYGCDNLTSVYMPDSITSIGELAFSYCYDLTNISISNNVISIGRYAFQGCYGLTELLISDSVESIGDGAFHSCSGLTSITIPSSVTSIGDYVFACCFNLTSINVSEDNAVYTSIDGVVYDKNITELLYYPIGKTSTLTIPDTVTSIGTAAFFSCYKLTDLTIPDGITSIGDSAFRSCEKLTNVTLPESVTYIGDYAFYYCPSLTSITILSKTITMGSFVFDTVDNNGDIVDGTLETVYCYEGSAADDSSLYPDGAEIIYLSEDTSVKGDLNDDGNITTKDAVLALQMAVGKTSSDSSGDVNGDGNVTTKDAVLILQYAVGKIDSFEQ